MIDSFVLLKDVCDKGSSNIAQKDLDGHEGKYPIYGAAGLIKHVDFFVQSHEYIAVVKDGAGIGKAMKLPACSSVIGTMQYILPKKNVNISYLYYAICAMHLEKYFTGATIPHIYFKDYQNEKLRLPALQKQIEIARNLELIDNLIDIRHQQFDKLEKLVNSRFVEMFGDPVKNELNWPIRAVEDCCRYIYGGGTPSKKNKEYFTGSIPWISSKDMKEFWITDSKDHITQEAIENSSAKLIPAYSVIMVIRSGILKHTLPIAVNKVMITVNQDLKAFIPLDDVSPVFLGILFKMLEKDILKNVRAVTADNLEFNSFRKRLIICPPIDLQNQFADFVQQVNKSKYDGRRSLLFVEEVYNLL